MSGTPQSDTDPINYFGHDGQFACFSNRCECYPFEIDGKKYTSAEAYFQSLKFFPNEKPMEEIRLAKSAAKASALGKRKDIPLRSDWETVKEEVMRTALTAKFSQNPKLGAILISTDSRELRFGLPGGGKKSDDFWGWQKGKGKNTLALILTKIRSDLKEKAEKDETDTNALLTSEPKAKEPTLRCVEYSRTGRATCKVCDNAIDKKDLRIGKRVLIRNKESHIWFHWECYFQKFPANSVDDWDGFDTLKEADKKKLREKVTDAPDNGSVEKAVQSTRAKDYANECMAEYSTSNRAACKWCKKTIAKETLRIAVMVKTMKFDGKIPQWHHVECFFEKVEIPDLDCMNGLKSLRWEDQQSVTNRFVMAGGTVKATPSTPPSSPKPKKKMNTANNTTTTTTTTTTTSTPSTPPPPSSPKPKKKPAATPTSESPNTKRKRDDDEEEDDEETGSYEESGSYEEAGSYEETGSYEEATQEEEDEEEEEEVDGADVTDLQQLSAKFWALKDKLKSNVSAPDLKMMLDENDQEAGGGFEKILEKCAEGMFYGAIPPCPSCKKGRLEKLSYNVYKCGGWLSEWTRCGFTKEVDEVERLDSWKIPSSLLESEFFSNFKFEKHDSALVYGGKKKRKEREPKVEKRAKTPKRRKTDSTAMKKVVVKGQSGLHPDSGLSETYHVLTDTKTTPPTTYNVTLSMSDISTGTNSYYIIQIAEKDSDKDSSLSPFLLFKKWGRVGTVIGSSSKVKCKTAADARKKFYDAYYDKTGNTWTNREKFEKKAGKYYPVEIDYGNQEALEDLKITGTNSKLTKPLQELIGLLFDVDLMAKTLVELEFDAEQTPLGMLGKGQIDKGFKILSEIQNLIDAEVDVESDRFRDLNNQFFTIIPHMFKRKETAYMVINTDKMVKEKVEMLDALNQIQVAYSLLRTDSGALDPLEANYKKLNTKLEHVPSTSPEFSVIANYIEMTSDKTADYKLELTQAFTVARDGEAEKFQAFKSTPNHMLLVHGSRLTNFVGILSKGLKIAPPDVPASGYLFGKGLYFADMFAKSAHYCRATEDNSTALLLLTEVALGKMYEVQKPEFMSSPPKGFNSTKALGKWNTSAALTPAIPGVHVPNTPPAQSKNFHMQHNEYIVYDEAQVHNRYLVQVKFHFK